MREHSSGAANAVEVLHHKERFQYIGQGISYDIWEGAIQRPEDEPSHRITTPLLAINSEAFMYWPDSFKSVMSLFNEVKEQDALVWMMTVRSSIHASQSDFSILYKNRTFFLYQPRGAIHLNINASLGFLKHVMPARISAMNRGTNEHLLEAKTLDGLPKDHQPNDKQTTVRLRIPHKLRIRLTPQWARRH